MLRMSVEDLAVLAAGGVDRVGFLARKARIQLCNRAFLRRGYIEHYGVHHPRNNAGDAVLFQAVEDLFDVAYGKQCWRRTLLRHEVSLPDINRINGRAGAVLVGGGGLLLSDTHGATPSGWQWRISRELLGELEVPLIVFAVGYNQFRDSMEFAPVFNAHLRDTVARSCFFGVRNMGSLERVRSHLPAHLEKRVVFQPCMTTILRYFYDLPILRIDKTFSKRVALNLAFDRAKSRYGNDRDAIIARINGIVEWAVGAGWEVTLVLQAWEDEPTLAAIRRMPGDGIRVQRLCLASPHKVIQFYANMPVTIGMRGHAQMIPFGCGNAVFSLLSHEKMRFFLEDIGRPEWGVDIRDRDLADKAIRFLSDLERLWGSVIGHIAEQQARLWAITRANLGKIGQVTGWPISDRNTRDSIKRSSPD